MAEFKLPTETIELPSKGLLYTSDNPLSSGTIEMKYMTAKEEDILTNQSYISDGTVFDKLFKSLIVSKINYDDLLIGDKNAILVAARILGYGKDYKFVMGSEEFTVDLSKIEGKGVMASGNIKEGEVIGPARINKMRTPLGRYTNHSKNPNAKMVLKENGDIDLVAVSNIAGYKGGQLGEEITVDYRQVLRLSLGEKSCQE